MKKGLPREKGLAWRWGSRSDSTLLTRIERIIAEVETFSETGARRSWSLRCLELSREIAERIVMEELSLKPEVMVNIVKEAMRKLERTGPITIKLNPAVHDLFMKLKPGLLEVHPDIIFDIDPSLTQTGQVVIGATEEVVTDIESQVRNLMEDIGVGQWRSLTFRPAGKHSGLLIPCGSTARLTRSPASSLRQAASG